MKTSIRNKLTALILAVCLSIILIIWLTTTLFFKPMYYNATQAELTGILEIDGFISIDILRRCTIIYK